MPDELDARLEELIAEAQASGGAERANYQRFVNDLCEVLGQPKPGYTKEGNAENDYVFERRIAFKHPDGSTTPGWIDCYRRGAFTAKKAMWSQWTNASTPI